MAAVNSRRNLQGEKSLYVQLIQIGGINANIETGRNNHQTIFIEKISNCFYKV
jgi:hypothetical protein